MGDRSLSTTALPGRVHRFFQRCRDPPGRGAGCPLAAPDVAAGGQDRWPGPGRPGGGHARDGTDWPRTRDGQPRPGAAHLFQFGAPGGATQREFFEGGPRVAEFLRRNGSDRERWRPPEPDAECPEAEWGFAEPFAADLTAAAGEQGLTIGRLRLEQPEDVSPLIAGLFRHWYAGRGLPTGRLLVSSFLLMDPVLAMRTGQVPYWALFGSRPSLDRLAGYLSGGPVYDDIRLTVFPHGMDSIGLPGIGEWQRMLGYASRPGQLLAIEPDHFPRHFRALTGFHRELSKLPRVPAGPPLAWDAARQYLASHAADHNVSFHIDHS